MIKHCLKGKSVTLPDDYLSRFIEHYIQRTGRSRQSAISAFDSMLDLDGPSIPADGSPEDMVADFLREEKRCR